MASVIKPKTDNITKRRAAAVREPFAKLRSAHPARRLTISMPEAEPASLAAGFSLRLAQRGHRPAPRIQRRP